ncbi:hypothetical protein [Endozoicomonas sp. YOMI1]|uniref:hypothetical protein n=1 Tax=Endozoicomonas sp. YOMI1 TaxID=2828739 RepID=UPI002148B97A|nr:hypothetical protein [Endozoicomonas sp. YOMI1]
MNTPHQNHGYGINVVYCLLTVLHDGDILSGDANFENYFRLALLLQAMADLVFKKKWCPSY